MISEWDGVGWDARAYHLAWDGSLYGLPPGAPNAYNYSPVFAQVLWPLTHLPWSVFCALAVGSAAVGVLWLLRPVSTGLLVPLLAVAGSVVLSGNVDWLIAVLTVLGVTRGAPWALAAFTKVTPCLGPLWFLARGEWPLLARAIGWIVLLGGVSFALSPGAWLDWISFLRDNSGRSPGMYPEVVPPLPLRILVAAALVVVAARRGRPSWLPVAMFLAVPVPSTVSLSLLLAIPRLREFERSRARQDSVDDRLDAVDQDLLGEARGPRDSGAGEQVVLGDATAGGALGADRQAPGLQHDVTQ
ncbi:glycosyltransferase family 87 protein [Nocardioides yefusunii]|uniref:glycosyltransferase family 87 protein n=1 Tax=Nocardioides yefusunii TaxID=2500546 RepID=UPI001EF00CF0|nr:glycosyltransferase family 87 protein [Nocardioides yefusunii]